MVEGVGALEAGLLARGEKKLDPCVRTALGEHATGRVEHRRDGGLVVAPEDRLVAVADDPVLDHRLDRIDRRDRVEVGAEKQRLPRGRRLDRDVDVPDVRADRRSGAVLVGRQPAVAEIGEHAIGDRALLTGGAGDRGKLENRSSTSEATGEDGTRPARPR